VPLWRNHQHDSALPENSLLLTTANAEPLRSENAAVLIRQTMAREYGSGREPFGLCDAYHSILLFFALAGLLGAALLVLIREIRFALKHQKPAQIRRPRSQETDRARGHT
jgi:hypothetical protein